MGENFDLSDFGNGMLLGARQAGFHAHQSLEFTQWMETKKRPVRSSSAGGNALLIREVGRE